MPANYLTTQSYVRQSYSNPVLHRLTQQQQSSQFQTQKGQKSKAQLGQVQMNRRRPESILRSYCGDRNVPSENYELLSPVDWDKESQDNAEKATTVTGSSAKQGGGNHNNYNSVPLTENALLSVNRSPQQRIDHQGSGSKRTGQKLYKNARNRSGIPEVEEYEMESSTDPVQEELLPQHEYHNFQHQPQQADNLLHDRKESADVSHISFHLANEFEIKPLGQHLPTDRWDTRRKASQHDLQSEDSHDLLEFVSAFKL